MTYSSVSVLFLDIIEEKNLDERILIKLSNTNSYIELSRIILNYEFIQPKDRIIVILQRIKLRFMEFRPWSVTHLNQFSSDH